MTKIQQAINAHQNKDLQTAKKLYAEILQLEPDNPDALHYYGVIESESNQVERGISYMEKSLSIKPNDPTYNNNLAIAYSRIGLIEKSIKHYNRVIELKPEFAEAYQGLTYSKSFSDDPSLLEKINKQLNLNTTSDIQKNYLHFAAAKIYADLKQYESAFSHYQNANQFKNVNFDVKRLHQETLEKIKFFNNEWGESKKEFGLYSHTPIFIVGMPRSGSTLVEQILSSHSDVYGAGELSDIASIIDTLKARTKNKRPDPFFLLETPETDLLGFGASYLQRLNQLSNNAARVVDKAPLNFKYIGLILLIFPNAKIIHTLRDPIDTCLSCYFQNFAKGQHYSFNLEHLAAFYNDYRKLMDHWHTLYPGKIYSLSYESLVAKQESETRKLLDFCELEWDNNCLSFHENKRYVATASKCQVRKPIYTDSLKRWQHYEPYLESLIKNLKY